MVKRRLTGLSVGEHMPLREKRQAIRSAAQMAVKSVAEPTVFLSENPLSSISGEANISTCQFIRRVDGLVGRALAHNGISSSISIFEVDDGPVYVQYTAEGLAHILMTGGSIPVRDKEDVIRVLMLLADLDRTDVVWYEGVPKATHDYIRWLVDFSDKVKI